MASTYTSRLRLTLQGDGDNAGTWGQVANTVFGLIDDSIGGVANIVATGSGEIDLTASVANGATDEARKAVLRFTGVPTANREVRIPSVEKIYFVDNAVSISSDSFYLLIHPDGTSAGVTIQPQERAILYCDGTNIYNMISNTSALDPSNNLSDLTNVSAALVNLGFTATIDELNTLDGITASVSELNILDGATLSVAELNILDGALIDVTELNYLNGVTSSIQEQFDVLTSLVGLAVTSASLVISEYYESSIVDWTHTAGTSFTHGLTTIPNMVVVELISLTSANGIAVGDVIEVSPHTDHFGVTNYGMGVYKTSTSIHISHPSGGNTLRIIPPNGNTLVATSSSFNIRVRAWT